VNKKSFTALAVTILFVLLGVAVYLYYTKTSNPEIDFTLSGIDSKQYKLSDWRGKVIVLNFWATWCLPCLREIPVFNKLQKKWQKQGVQFVGVAMDEKENVEDFIQKTPLNYPTMLGEIGSMQIAKKLGNSHGVLPYTVIFDHDGAIIKTHAGEVTETMLINLLSSYL